MISAVALERVYVSTLGKRVRLTCINFICSSVFSNKNFTFIVDISLS